MQWLHATDFVTLAGVYSCQLKGKVLQNTYQYPVSLIFFNEIPWTWTGR